MCMSCTVYYAGKVCFTSLARLNGQATTVLRVVVGLCDGHFFPDKYSGQKTLSLHSEILFMCNLNKLPFGMLIINQSINS